MTDRAVMRRLLRLASRRKGLTYPNPITAAAVVCDGVIVGLGVHQRAGEPHAEVLALREAGALTIGATLFVTLEPCTMAGRTPACVDAIIRSGVSRVVFAADDPNPLVKARRAADVLRQAGIAVESGLLGAESMAMNDVFGVNMAHNRPFVWMRSGMSADGKIALSTGESMYITNEASRRQVHRFRRECDAILVGAGTVRTDDPALTVRYGLLRGGYRNPTRVVLDPRGSLHYDYRVFLPNADVILVVDPTVVALQSVPSHVCVLPVRHESGQVVWADLLAALYARGVCAVLLEGGSRVFTSALKAGVVDRIDLFVASVFLGGKGLPLLDANWEVPHLADGVRFRFLDCRFMGGGLGTADIWIRGARQAC